jgi:hypothetical protein
MTLVYFVISSLDVMGELGRITDKQTIIDFVHSCQILPQAGEGCFVCSFVCLLT